MMTISSPLKLQRHSFASGPLLLFKDNNSGVDFRTNIQNLPPIPPIRTLSLLGTAAAEDINEEFLPLENIILGAVEIKILNPDPFKYVDDAIHRISSTVDHSVSSRGQDDRLYEQGSSPPALTNNQKLLVTTNIAKGSNPCWNSPSPFTKFRWQYLLAYIGIMLADGLQGMNVYLIHSWRN